MEIEIKMGGEGKEEGEEKEYGEYECKHACDCLIEAEMIKKNPKLMAKVQPMLDDKMGALQKITSMSDLKKVAKKKLAE